MWQIRGPKFCGATKHCIAETSLLLSCTAEFTRLEKLQDSSLQVRWTELVSAAEAVQVN